MFLRPIPGKLYSETLMLYWICVVFIVSRLNMKSLSLTSLDMSSITYKRFELVTHKMLDKTIEIIKLVTQLSHLLYRYDR